MIGPIRFVFTVWWFAIGLAVFGNLKECTLVMAGMAAKSQQAEAYSMGKWNRKLVGNGH